MRSFELGRKTTVDGPARLALASRSVMRLPGGRSRPGGTSLSSTAQRSGFEPVGPAGFRAPSPGREGGTPRGRKHRPAGARPRHGRGMMRIERRYTKEGQSPYAEIPFRLAVSEIRNPDGSIVFRQDGIEVPAEWSQVATDVLAQKYFRKAGVPARLKKVEENAVPSFLWRSEADAKALSKLPEGERAVSEHSAKQVFDRLAGCWAYWGWKGGY